MGVLVGVVGVLVGEAGVLVGVLGVSDREGGLLAVVRPPWKSRLRCFERQ